MRILVLGAGATGGYFGGRLAQAGADVTFLVRPARAARLAARGLEIESPATGDARIAVQTCTTVDPQARFDVVLLSCKAYDLDAAIDAIAPAMGAETFVLPLLNGYAHLDRLVGRFGAGRVVGGLAKIQATLSPEGVVRHLNDWRYLTVGELDGASSDRVEALKRLFDATPVGVTLSGNIRREMWMKLVHLSTVAGMTCLLRGSVGEIARTREGTDILRRFFRLNLDIAAREGHEAAPAFVAEFDALFGTRDSAYSASMARDIERGGPVEADHILGFMLERARAHGLEDTLHQLAWTHCKVYEERRAAGRLPA